MRSDRSIKSLFIAAGILVTLGLGNILFGQYRLSHYQRLLSTATQEEISSKSRTSESTDGLENTRPAAAAAMPVPNIDRHSRFVRNIKARIDFYSLVVLGGRCMLAFAGVCLLGILLHRKIQTSELG